MLIKLLKNQLNKIIYHSTLLFLMPAIALADEQNPITSASTHLAGILFGVLGGSICAIFIGSAFMMAKAGKCGWDRVVVTIVCSAGFLGAPAMVVLIRAWVS